MISAAASDEAAFLLAGIQRNGVRFNDRQVINKYNPLKQICNNIPTNITIVLRIVK